MEMGSVANSHKLATMILEMWIVEHARCLEGCPEEPPTGIDGTVAAEDEGREKRQSQKVAAWQDFWQDLCNLCERFARRMDRSDDQWSESGNPLLDARLDASSLWQLAVMPHLLGLPDDLWNAILLLRNQERSEIRAPGAADGVTVTRDRGTCFAVSAESTGETVREDKLDALEGILREMLTEVKWIARQGMPEVHELMTEPFAIEELAKLFRCHRNQVPKKVLPKYKHDEVGKDYRMCVKDMPPAYFLQLLGAIPVFTDRGRTRQSHHREDANARRSPANQ